MDIIPWLISPSSQRGAHLKVVRSQEVLHHVRPKLVAISDAVREAWGWDPE